MNKYLAMAVTWIITRLPGHKGSKCLIYWMKPTGPWPGVCEKACKNPIGDLGLSTLGACYFVAGLNVVNTKEELAEKLKTGASRTILVWYDIPYWLTPWLPRKSMWALFWDGIDSE